MDNKPISRKLKKIDLKQESFEANGKKYFIESGIRFERYLMYQKLQVELGYEVGFDGLYNKIKKIWELCGKMQFNEIAVLTHNIMNGIKTVENRRIPALELCALFINTEDEDRGVITDEMVKAKIADWDAEGLDIGSFFAVAMSFMKGFLPAYKDIIQLTSAINEEEKSKQT